MKLHVPFLIEKKRDGGALTAAEIEELISRFTRGDVLDAQMSAFAMAVFFRGMSPEETAALTRAMRDSGNCFHWPADGRPVVDKHSSGGVGDKTSLVLAPLLACDNLRVPMVSGRGLGITGGTLDKLESIPGFRTDLPMDVAQRQIEKIGVFIAGQSATFCPADKKLYALRDVTGTVPSLPLIAASIMSKKLAESLDRLVLDVKFGSGAFMQSESEAKALADAMVETGNANGVRTTALLSPMDHPLGHAAGNALEVLECLDLLEGEGPAEVRDLILRLAEKVSDSPRTRLEALLDSGKVLEKFLEMVSAQGGDVRSLEDRSFYRPAPVIRPLPAPGSGVLRRIDARAVGEAIVLLGGGRATPADPIDPSVGIDQILPAGTTVSKDDPLCRIHAPDEQRWAVARDLLLKRGVMFA
jgi:pyrimidine-nucleoside phosphorylase